MGIIHVSIRNRRAFTLSDVCVVLCLAGLLLTMLLVVRGKARNAEDRLVCSSNLKQIAAAMIDYSNHNNGKYPRMVFDANKPAPTEYTGVNSRDPFGNGGPAANDVTAVIFLLARAGLWPNYLVCPSSNAVPYDAALLGDVAARSNFPSRQYLSYSISNPYYEPKDIYWVWGAALPTDFALASDMNPGTPIHSPRPEIYPGNSANHDGSGQNVLYGDYRVAWQQTPFCGYPRPDGTQDNIFTSHTTPPTVGGIPQDDRDSVMLPLSTAGLQPLPRPAISRLPGGGSGLLLICGIVGALTIALVFIVAVKRAGAK